MKKVLLLFSLFFLIYSTPSFAENNFKKSNILLVLKSKKIPKSTKKKILRADGQVLRTIKIKSKRVLLVQTNQLKRDNFLRAINKEPVVEAAEENRKIKALFNPDDAYYVQGSLNGLQWNLNRINVAEAWDKTQGKGAIVAVLDTGISRKLSDINYSNVLRGYDFVNNDDSPTDDNGHGSHMSGVIASRANNGIGIAGVAPQAKILPVKVLDANGIGDGVDLIDGMIYAYEKGANIINMSFDIDPSSRVLKVITDELARDGIIICAASGNNGIQFVSYPARYSSVISVGATNFDNTRASYSNFGRELNIMAPGGDLEQDQNNDGYQDGILSEAIPGSEGTQLSSSYYFYDGTSAATAQVSGVAALLYAQGLRGYSHYKQALFRTATDIGAPGYDIFHGYGLVNASGAVNADKSKLSLRTSKARIKYGQKTQISGRLSPAKRATVYVMTYNNIEEQWKTSLKIQTSKDGFYKRNIRPERNTYIKADYRGTSSIIGQTSNEKIIYVKALISVNKTKSLIKAGDKLALAGKIRPAHKGKLVAIQARTKGRWKTLKRTRLDKHSKYEIVIILNQRKSYKLRVYMKDSDHHASVSKIISVVAN